MEKNATPSLPPSLEEVRGQFEDWRRTRNNRRDPIPSRLWEAAVELSDSYSINIVVNRELKLYQLSENKSVPP